MTDSRSNLVAIVIITALIVAGCRSEEKAAEQQPIRTVRAMKVADYAEISRRSFPGRAAATQEVNLSFRVSGPLIELPINVGDEVKKDDVIAQIDTTDFRVAVDDASAKLNRAERELDAMKVARPEEIRVAEQNTTAAKAKLANAEADYGRDKELVKSRAVSKREYDRSLALLEISQAQLEAAQEQLGKLQAGARTEDIAAQKAEIRSLNAALKNAQNQLRYTALRAPFDGTITTKFVDNFQTVQNGQMIVRLLDKSRIEFDVNIPETLISMVPFVRDVRVRFDAFPDLEVPAEITEIGREASATTRTFPVTVIMDQPEEARILPGMAGRLSATATPPGDQKQLEIVIPVTAVLSPQVENKSYVWVIDPTSNIARSREVQLGKLTSAGYVVGEGLTPGEMIATSGVHFLSEGQAVKPMIQ